jgi:hypothetical protein
MEAEGGVQKTFAVPLKILDSVDGVRRACPRAMVGEKLGAKFKLLRNAGAMGSEVEHCLTLHFA